VIAASLKVARARRAREAVSYFGDHVIAASLKAWNCPWSAPSNPDFGDHVIAASLKGTTGSITPRESGISAIT